jgi:glycosyltransferase involved in cell wall biosynthesis
LKIAYVCYWNLLSKDGVAEKINAQIGQWRKAGHDVTVFCLSRAQAGELADSWILFRFVTLVGRATATRRLVGAVREFEPDFVYFRYDLFVPPPAVLLRRRVSAVEINADDRAEAKLRQQRTKPSSAYNEFNRRAVLSSVSGMVCVTNELARSPAFASFGKPAAVIANAVDLDRIVPAPPPRNARPRVAFLGSRLQAWHGVDKILWLAAELPDVEFDIVGYAPRDLEAPVPSNVRVHGVLAHEEYEPIVAACDAAIGTLALHRKDMREACPLKVREYLAFGVPVVVGYDDTDFLGERPWFMLRLPNEEENVRRHVEEIRSFLDRVRGRRVPRDEVAERIGVHAKEVRRLAFFEALGGSRDPNSQH